MNYIISILKMLNLQYSAYCTLYKNKPTDLICENTSNLFKINSLLTTLSIKPSQLFYDIDYNRTYNQPGSMPVNQPDSTSVNQQVSTSADTTHDALASQHKHKSHEYTDQYYEYTKEYYNLDFILQSLNSNDIIFIDTVYSLGDTYQARIARLEYLLQSGALIIFMDELIWKRYNTSFTKSLYKDSENNLNNTKELLQVIRKKSQSNIKRIIKREVINMAKSKDTNQPTNTDNQNTNQSTGTTKKQPTKNPSSRKVSKTNKTKKAVSNIMKELDSMILDDDYDISFEQSLQQPTEQIVLPPEQLPPEQIVLPEVKAISEADNNKSNTTNKLKSVKRNRTNRSSNKITDLSFAPVNNDTDSQQHDNKMNRLHTQKQVVPYTVLKRSKSKELSDRSHRARIRFQQLQDKYPIENQLLTVDNTDQLSGVSLSISQPNKEYQLNSTDIKYPDKNSLEEFVEFFDNMVQNPNGTGKQIISLEDIRSKYEFSTVVEVLNYYNYCCNNV